MIRQQREPDEGGLIAQDEKATATRGKETPSIGLEQQKPQPVTQTTTPPPSIATTNQKRATCRPKYQI
ncbi:hypothetical protein P8452_15944 [Trifolium repens]|nr:hypothetical protein P8452_15944 [Trifolium repens]